MYLAFAPFGKDFLITAINVDEKTKHHLADLGIIIGETITPIIDQNGSMILKVKESRLAISKTLALRIQGN
ncbi:MAG: ferrous iron transport protein A [Erysipelotrichaceae bacterium]|jgi:ferrous iron transport protein A|nr:ferrous iron transport protein A [Erysipelotrichaceae bacterium]